MGKTLRTIVLTGTVAAAFLGGCKPSDPPERDNRSTLINYDGEKNIYTVEKFYDSDKDGVVEVYIVGPPLRDVSQRQDVTLPDNTSKETRAFVSAAFAQPFYDKHGKGAEMKVTYNSDSEAMIMHQGVKAETMSEEMQSRVDRKYQTLRDPVIRE